MKILLRLISKLGKLLGRKFHSNFEKMPLFTLNKNSAIPSIRKISTLLLRMSSVYLNVLISEIFKYVVFFMKFFENLGFNCQDYTLSNYYFIIIILRAISMDKTKEKNCFQRNYFCVLFP